jgi:hypothetical protein
VPSFTGGLNSNGGNTFATSEAPTPELQFPSDVAQPVCSLEAQMGKGILLWLLGIPIPIIILVLIFWH